MTTSSAAVNRRRLAVLTAGALAGACFASAAEARALKPVGGGAVVKSVDGPAELTVAVGRRTLPLRLHFVDAPRPGECGATEARAALNGFVRRAPGKLTYALVPRGKRSFARDGSGRLLAQLSYRVRGRWRDFADDLTRAGWARRGEPATAETTASTFAGWVPDAAPISPGAADLFDPAATRRGSWTRCGGRLHLPLSEPPASTSAAAWVTDEYGVTRAIGALELSGELTPERALTMRRLAAAVPTEFASWGYGCTAFVPSLQIWAMGSFLQPVGGATACGDQLVGLITSSGPDAAQFTRVGGVGRPVRSLTSAFPLLELASDAEYDGEDNGLLLSGDGSRQWAWQTGVETDRKERVSGLTTWQAPVRPGA